MERERPAGEAICDHPRFSVELRPVADAPRALQFMS
jgi:hypothetical protein